MAESTQTVATLSSENGRLRKSMQELYAMSDAETASCDIAELNLLAARGLPGAEGLDVQRCLSILDRWARRIQLQTSRHIDVFRRNPGKFRSSEAYWRILALTTTLWSECNIRYNMERIEKEDWSDSRDILIHGLLGPKRTGTCASLPVLVVALGRRLGYPLYLARTVGHRFFRWESADTNECINFEFSGDGLDCHTDQYYREWPAKWPPDLLADEAARGEKRLYLRSLTPTEEFAGALSMRAVCLEAAGRWEEALEAHEATIRFDPGYPAYVMYRDDLKKKMLAAEELTAEIAATTPNFNPNLPALITAKVQTDREGPLLSIFYKQLPRPIAPSDPSFDPTFKPPPGVSPALFRIRKVVNDVHSRCHPMAGFRPANPPTDL